MSKKLKRGGQLPRQGWIRNHIMQVKSTRGEVECPMINIRVGDCVKPHRWLVDSGAKESVIDHEFYRQNFQNEKLDPMEKGVLFRGADGSPLVMLGSFLTSFLFDKIHIVGRVFVCQGITTTRLIGANILSQFDSWGIDNKRRYFIIGDLEIPLVEEATKPPHSSDVTLAKDVVVPSRCSQIVLASLQSRFIPSELIFQPDRRLFYKKQLLIPVCLVSTNFFDSTTTIRITNPTDKEITIKRGAKLGRVINSVDDYELVLQDGNDQCQRINSVQKMTQKEMEEILKKEHKELYNLFCESIKNLSATETTELLRLLFKYKHVFSVDDTDIGNTNIITHRINTKSDKIVYRRQYRHSEDQHRQIEEEVEKLLECGVIKPSMSPYNNPVLMVPKKEKGKWRFCLDCRYINDLIEDQYFPIPRIDDVISSLSGATIFSVVDQTSGYHQVELEEESSDMLAFSTRKGHYQYTRLPMGLRGSGMTFQKMVTLLLSGMLQTEVLAYLDDCILYGNSIKQHMNTLEEVLKRFGNANLKLKPRKCRLFQTSIVYLGYLVDSTGVRPNPEATKLIRDIPNPSNVKEVQRFIGKANYYRRFIPNLAMIAHPLYELIKSKGRDQFKWTEEHQGSFDKIKSILTSNQVMGHPRLDREFVLDVDASDYALGVELSQPDGNGALRPIFYGSRHLSKSERNYSATARETLAVVFGCEQFREYLQGRRFTIRSDHNPLVWLRGMKEPKRPYSGWIMRLEQFEYKIEYRPGKEHANADYNSRVSGMPEPNKCFSRGTQTVDIMPIMKSCVNSYEKTKELLKHSECGSLFNNYEHPESNITAVGARVDPSKSPLLSVIEKPPDVQGSLNSYKAEIEARDDPRESISLGLLGTGINGRDDPLKSHSSKTIAEIGTGEREDPLKFHSPEIAVEMRADGRDDPLESPPAEIVLTQQRQDADIAPVIRKILNPQDDIELTKKGERLWRDRKRLKINNGLLVRQYQVRALLKPIEQIVLPSCLKDMVMETLHDSPFAGHFGVKRTAVRVQLRYYWPGYLVDIEDWCKSCLVCQQRKSPSNLNVAPLTSIHTGEGPFERIALDILKLPLTQSGNQYLLVIEDFFSKWVEAFPLKRTVAPCVAQCLLNGWVSRFGCPYTILSDQGTEFESKLFKSLNEMLQVKKLRTTTYHPRTDGMVERSNRTLIDILSKYCEKTDNWDLKLPLVLFAIRTSEHSTTGFSPFSLVYGREAKIPWDIAYGPAPNTPMPREDWVAERKKHMSKVFQMVQEITKKKQMVQKKYFDSKLGKFQVFEMGEAVMYCDPGTRSKVGKLNKPWLGPFKVVEKVSDALYKVDLNGKVTMVNAERLKKFYPRRIANDDSDGDGGYVQECNTSDEESFEEAIGGEEPPGQVENAHLQGNEPQVQEHVELPNPIEGWGENGELRCNIDPGNIVQGGRRREV